MAPTPGLSRSLHVTLDWSTAPHLPSAAKTAASSAAWSLGSTLQRILKCTDPTPDNLVSGYVDAQESVSQQAVSHGRLSTEYTSASHLRMPTSAGRRSAARAGDTAAFHLGYQSLQFRVSAGSPGMILASLRRMRSVNGFLMPAPHARRTKAAQRRWRPQHAPQPAADAPHLSAVNARPESFLLFWNRSTVSVPKQLNRIAALTISCTHDPVISVRSTHMTHTQ